MLTQLVYYSQAKNTILNAVVERLRGGDKPITGCLVDRAQCVCVCVCVLRVDGSKWLSSRVLMNNKHRH